MAFRDLREFIDALEKEKELVKVKQEVDWNLEAGAIIRRAYEMEEKATLFEKVKDAPGVRMMGGPCGTYSRMSVAMGMKADTPVEELAKEFDKRIENPIKPMLVSDGPCKENIIKGDDIDLFKLGAPMAHDGDGGRYIGTWQFIVTRDLEDTGWVNWGMYRQMIHTENTMGGLILPGQDIGRMYQKYEKADKPMPFASVIGGDPLTVVGGSLSAGPGECEADLCGGLRKAPIELVKCETVDLEVPAGAEIVIEGHVLPHVRVEEGPFGEYTGFRTSPRAPRPVYEVTCITHRNNPILTVSNMGTPVDEADIVMTLAWRNEAIRALKSLPVVEVAMPSWGSGHLVVVSVQRAYSGVANHVANAVWGSKLGYLVPFVIVVDEDVDVFNLGEVMHSIVQKCHPVRGVHSRPNTPGHGLYPFLNFQERLWGNAANLLLDCTWPVGWDPNIEIPPKASFGNVYPKDIQDKVVKNWKKYGF
ncbi:putative phenylphosphate carboxylase, alpha subunit [delta proteobacterium NaphS2]|nr:putative phenylphosphate carboxylase, alpha subunit [delta proteobacterium NaphS2]